EACRIAGVVSVGSPVDREVHAIALQDRGREVEADSGRIAIGQCLLPQHGGVLRDGDADTTTARSMVIKGVSGDTDRAGLRRHPPSDSVREIAGMPAIVPE